MNEGLLDFYKTKRVFITGHTGFKGSWLCKILTQFGSEVMGYALEPPTEPSLFKLADIESNINSTIADIRDSDAVYKAVSDFQPHIVIHMAAQPIVRYSYENPVETFNTNVMGTVNILDAVRRTPSVESVVNVTTDKVYRNNEWEWGYREVDRLGGRDPYSNSKSCSELVTDSYRESFLADSVAVSTARAGNVIGGGDFAKDRIIPDCVRAVESGTPLCIRNPHSTRPYQHVLEPLFAYLKLAMQQIESPKLIGAYNIGPGDEGCTSTEELVSIFAHHWGTGFSWKIESDNGPRESNFLKLDISKIQSSMGWKPRWTIDEAVEKTVEWTQNWLNDGNVAEEMNHEISVYLSD